MADIRTTTSATIADLARSDRVGLFTGRGDTSTPIGLVFAYTDAPPPDPATVAMLPIGRRLLTATTEHDYRTALVAFATAWRAGGFGDTLCDHTDPPANLGTCPPADGENTDRWAGTAYTFDDGQVLYYRPHTGRRPGGHWHTITFTDPRGSAVEVRPATRRYGEGPGRGQRADMTTEPAKIVTQDLAPGQVPVAVFPTEITVTCMPIDDPYYGGSLDIKVKYRGRGLYGVFCRGDLAIARDGTVSSEPLPCEREDEWIDHHRFDLDTALRVATLTARQVEIGPKDHGMNVTEALRRRAQAMKEHGDT